MQGVWSWSNSPAQSCVYSFIMGEFVVFDYKNHDKLLVVPSGSRPCAVSVYLWPWSCLLSQLGASLPALNRAEAGCSRGVPFWPTYVCLDCCENFCCHGDAMRERGVCWSTWMTRCCCLPQSSRLQAEALQTQPPHWAKMFLVAYWLFFKLFWLLVEFWLFPQQNNLLCRTLLIIWHNADRCVWFGQGLCPLSCVGCFWSKGPVSKLVLQMLI